MIRALILAYDFPPYVSVGGQRPYSWHRYLRDHGIEPVVVTRQWEHRFGGARDYVAASASPHEVLEETPYGRIIRAPYHPTLGNRLFLRYGPRRYRLLRRAISGAYEVAQYFLDVGPKRSLFHSAAAHIESHGTDVIVATGDPFVLFRFAAQLSCRYRLPWVADYRDPWTNSRRRLGRYLLGADRALERRIVRTAAAVTSVCAAFVPQGLCAPHRPFHLVPNGFDPEVIRAAADVAQGHDRLTIAHAGTVTPWHPIEAFFRACARSLASAGPQFQVLFYGGESQERLASALARASPDLQAVVRLLPRLPHREVVQRMASANAFLTFDNYQQPGTKIYDYIALGRRILFCFTDDPEARRLRASQYNLRDYDPHRRSVVESMVVETQSGTPVRDEAHLAELIIEMCGELRVRGEVSCRPVNVEKYSREHAAATMATALRVAAIGGARPVAPAQPPRPEE